VRKILNAHFRKF